MELLLHGANWLVDRAAAEGGGGSRPQPTYTRPMQVHVSVDGTRSGGTDAAPVVTTIGRVPSPAAVSPDAWQFVRQVASWIKADVSFDYSAQRELLAENARAFGITGRDAIVESSRETFPTTAFAIPYPIVLDIQRAIVSYDFDVIDRATDEVVAAGTDLLHLGKHGIVEKLDTLRHNYEQPAWARRQIWATTGSKPTTPASRSTWSLSSRRGLLGLWKFIQAAPTIDPPPRTSPPHPPPPPLQLAAPPSTKPPPPLHGSMFQTSSGQQWRAGVVASAGVLVRSVSRRQCTMPVPQQRNRTQRTATATGGSLLAADLGLGLGCRCCWSPGAVCGVGLRVRKQPPHQNCPRGAPGTPCSILVLVSYSCRPNTHATPSRTDQLGLSESDPAEGGTGPPVRASEARVRA